MRTGVASSLASLSYDCGRACCSAVSPARIHWGNDARNIFAFHQVLCRRRVLVDADVVAEWGTNANCKMKSNLERKPANEVYISVSCERCNDKVSLQARALNSAAHQQNRNVVHKTTESILLRFWGRLNARTPTTHMPKREPHL